MNELSAYESAALKKIHSRVLKPTVFDKAIELAPENVKNVVSGAKDKISNAVSLKDGSDAGIIRKGISRSLEGLNTFLAKSAQSLTRRFDVKKDFAKAGFEVRVYSDIHKIDLEDVDKVRPASLISYFSIAGLLGGAGAGLVITGGELFVAESAGAAAAPGFGTIAATLAADAAAVQLLCHSVVAQTARYYGFDPESPDETLLALGVLNAGSALTQSSKYAALADLSRMTQRLARRATWEQLNQTVLANVAKRFAKMMEVRLTKAGLSKLAPAIGIVVGAGSNFYIIHEVAVEADFYYRERFLNQKRGGGEISVPLPSGPIDDDSDSIDIFEIFEEEEVEALDGDQ